MFRKFQKRDRRTLVDTTGYVDLPTACVRANKTGFFGLTSRVAPESFDAKDTNIDPRDCFFGGRRVELAVTVKNAGDLATKAGAPSGAPSGGEGTEPVSGE